MSPIRLISRGFFVGDWQVPPFELRQGEAITLSIPERGARCDELIKLLSGRIRDPGLDVFGQSEWAAPAEPRRGLRGWLRPDTSISWLVRNGRFTPQSAQVVADRHNLPRGLRLSMLAGNPRALLGLEAAFSRGSDLVLFSDVGLDPKGSLMLFEIARSHLNEVGLVFIGSPCISEGKLVQRFMPGTGIIEITNRSEVLA